MRYGRTTVIIVLGTFVVVAPLATQAQTTTDKVENKMEQAKDKAKSTTEDVKAAVSDSWITSKTKIALFADQRVKGSHVSVDTKDGVVHVRGKVESDEAKSAATEAAKGIDGAKSVKNDLQVVSPAARKTVDVSDKDITKAVQSRLSKDAQLKKVGVRVDDGVVTLTGEVASITLAAKASERVRTVSGVKSVKNELTVQQVSK